MLGSLLPDLPTRSVTTVSMRLSDGSVLLNSQNPAGGGSLIETLPTVVSTANALDVATTNPRPRRIELPNFSTNVCIVITFSASIWCP
jgi:hypothetical protein